MQNKYVKIFERGRTLDELDFSLDVDDVSLDRFTWTPFNGAEFDIDENSIGIDTVEGDRLDEWIAFEHTELTQMFEELVDDSIDYDMLRNAVEFVLEGTLTLASREHGIAAFNPNEIADYLIKHIQQLRGEAIASE